MPTDETTRALRDMFGDPKEAVSFTGRTEVVNGMRRVYPPPDTGTFIAFPEGDDHVEERVDAATSTIWVKNDEAIEVHLRRNPVDTDWLKGPIGEIRLSAPVRADDLATLLPSGTDVLCLSRSTRTRGCGEDLLWHTLANPGPLPGMWGR